MTEKYEALPYGAGGGGNSRGRTKASNSAKKGGGAANGVIALTASEFAELEACMTTPRAPTASILQGAALLTRIRSKNR